MLRWRISLEGLFHNYILREGSEGRGAPITSSSKLAADQTSTGPPSEIPLNCPKCAKVDVTMQGREQNGSNVELQDELSGQNQLRQLRRAYQLEFDSRFGWFGFDAGIDLDVE